MIHFFRKIPHDFLFRFVFWLWPDYLNFCLLNYSWVDDYSTCFLLFEFSYLFSVSKYFSLSLLPQPSTVRRCVLEWTANVWTVTSRCKSQTLLKNVRYSFLLMVYCPCHATCNRIHSILGKIDFTTLGLLTGWERHVNRTGCSGSLSHSQNTWTRQTFLRKYAFRLETYFVAAYFCHCWSFFLANL